jgi:hypothetical protein
MNFRIGDRVKMDKEKVISTLRHITPIWYTEEIFTIINIENNTTVILDRSLPNADNKIHSHYLKLLKTDRKKKLLKLATL